MKKIILSISFVVLATTITFSQEKNDNQKDKDHHL